MGCDTYSVWIEGVAMARYMPIDVCMLFVKALILDGWNENDLTVTIIKEQDCER
jgi:hypothetical protein